MKRFLLILCALVLALLCRSAAVPDARVLTGAADTTAANTHGSGRSSCGKLLAGGSPGRARGLGSPGTLREIPLLQQRFTPSAIQFPQCFLPGRRDRHGLRPGAPLSECVLHAAFLRREPFPSRVSPESPDLIQNRLQSLLSAIPVTLLSCNAIHAPGRFRADALLPGTSMLRFEAPPAHGRGRPASREQTWHCKQQKSDKIQ